MSLDTVYLLMALKKHNSNEMPMQRLKRADEFSTFLIFSTTLIDLGLTGLYLVTLLKGQAKQFEALNEMIALLPNLFGLVRHSGPKGAIALGAIDGVAAVTNFGLGIKVLKDTVAEIG